MRWSWSRVIPVAVAVAVLIGAAIGFEQVIPVHHVERSRLSKLVVSTPPPGFTTKGANRGEMTAASNPFSSVKASAQKSPNTTGGYSATWNGSPVASNSLSLLATMLPSTRASSAVLAQALTQYQKPASFTSLGYQYDQPFQITTPAGASAQDYAIHKGKTNQYVAVVVYRSGRTVVAEFAQEGSVASANATAGQLAASEYAHLKAMGSAVSLTTTRYPVTATVVWWAVAGALAVAILATPLAVRRARRLQLERAARNARKAFHGRGGKIAKRQAVRRR